VAIGGEVLYLLGGLKQRWIYLFGGFISLKGERLIKE
jgi:hypothetical protein